MISDRLTQIWFNVGQPRFWHTELELDFGGTFLGGLKEGGMYLVKPPHRHMVTHIGTSKKKITLQRFFVFWFWTESSTPCCLVPVKWSMCRNATVFVVGVSPIFWKRGWPILNQIKVYLSKTDHIGNWCRPLTTGLDKLGAFSFFFCCVDGKWVNRVSG